MGPLENIGPYAETVISTRKSDVKSTTDNKPVFCDLLIGVLVVPLGLSVAGLMWLYVWANIGPITSVVVIGLAFWACGHYGTEHSMFNRHYQTKLEHDRIVKRLYRKTGVQS